MSTATAIKEHPILYGSAMVRGLISGTKTQTRRTLKDQTGATIFRWTMRLESRIRDLEHSGGCR